MCRAHSIPARQYNRVFFLGGGAGAGKNCTAVKYVAFSPAKTILHVDRIAVLRAELILLIHNVYSQIVALKGRNCFKPSQLH